MALTKKDVGKLSDVFATKKDLEAGLSNLRSEIKDQVLTSEDRIIKKLEDVSIEQKMSRTQDRRQDEKLENHEERIKSLEVKV